MLVYNYDDVVLDVFAWGYLCASGGVGGDDGPSLEEEGLFETNGYDMGDYWAGICAGIESAGNYGGGESN